MLGEGKQEKIPANTFFFSHQTYKRTAVSLILLLKSNTNSKSIVSDRELSSNNNFSLVEVIIAGIVSDRELSSNNNYESL